MRTIALILAIFLPGCAGFTSFEQGIAGEGAKVADTARDTAEFTLCKGITVGAWVRAYGASADKAAAWRTLCASTVNQVPAPAQQ